MLLQLKPSIELLQQYFDSARRYYAVTRRYATVAQAGWARDRSVNDSDFVISAYQASQIMGIGTNGAGNPNLVPLIDDLDPAHSVSTDS